MQQKIETKEADNQKQAQGNNNAESLVIAVNGITSTIEEIAKQVDTSKKVANEAAGQSHHASESAKLLEESAQSIGEIVEVIGKIAKQINLLSLNATIEASRAGEAGKGFSVVASEVKDLSTQTAKATSKISDQINSMQMISKDVIEALDFLNTSVVKVNEYSGKISSTVGEQTHILEGINTQAQKIVGEFRERDAIRLTEMSQTLVQLIVRNLYERTADVRWWATDEAFYKCMENITPELCQHAIKRLGIINQFYSVYMNLLLVDKNGKVVATSRPEKFPKIIGESVASCKWFNDAIKTKKGDEYVVDEIYKDSLHNNTLVSVYATAIRKGGEIEGAITGVLGVFFDWEAQSKVIVCDEPNLSKDEWIVSTVMLLDSGLRIIASSDNKNLLNKFDLKHNSQKKGHYSDPEKGLVTFAKTLGYQEYDGLGWYGVIIQKT